MIKNMIISIKHYNVILKMVSIEHAGINLKNRNIKIIRSVRHDIIITQKNNVYRLTCSEICVLTL